VLHQEKYDALCRNLAELGSVIVAYSGGADSALLLKVAHDTLGDQALGVIGLSPSYSSDEREQALAFAREWRLPVLEICTEEMENPQYVANAGNRCYYCKTELFDKLEAVRRERSFAVVVDGFNVDDEGDYRPGVQAAREHAVRHPLQEAGLTKAELRHFSRALGLKTWDKPAMPCLSSRVPVGTPIQIGTLRQIDESEQALRSLGFRQLRVRHHGKLARIEVPIEDLPRLIEPGIREQVVQAIKQAGYQFVTLDLAGYRMGSVNPVVMASSTSRSPALSGLSQNA
jgi:uncharacterized protein